MTKKENIQEKAYSTFCLFTLLIRVLVLIFDRATVYRQLFVRIVFVRNFLFDTPFYDKHVCATLNFTTSTFVWHSILRQARLCDSFSDDKHVCGTVYSANGKIRRERRSRKTGKILVVAQKNRSWRLFWFGKNRRDLFI